MNLEEIKNKKALLHTIIENNKYKKVVEEFTIILSFNKILLNAVRQEELLRIQDETTLYEKEIFIKGETILSAINRHNIRVHEIEYIIHNSTITRSVEDEVLITKQTNLIYSKHES